MSITAERVSDTQALVRWGRWTYRYTVGPAATLEIAMRDGSWRKSWKAGDMLGPASIIPRFEAAARRALER